MGHPEVVQRRADREVVRTEPRLVDLQASLQDGHRPVVPTVGHVQGGEVVEDVREVRVVSGDVAMQTDRALKNLSAILTAAGSELEKVVRATVFLKNMNDFTAMNAVYGKYFKSAPPARSTVEVARLPKDVLVEIDVIALA